MRWSLGTAVFSGMLGVTLFGVFLTPLFFYVIEGISETSLFRLRSFQRIGSVVFGCALGVLAGFLTWKAGLPNWRLALVGGFALGLGTAAMVQFRRHRTSNGTSGEATSVSESKANENAAPSATVTAESSDTNSPDSSPTDPTRSNPSSGETNHTEGQL